MLTEQLHAFVDQLAKALELVGVAIILGGIILATVAFLRDGSRTSDWRSAYPRYRSDIGRGILLGLELLVGADIISTIAAPLTFESVYMLGRVNFLDDPSFPPHMKTAELAAAFGVSEATIHAKARLIENALGVSMFDPQWTVSRLIERNPLTWMAQVGGIIVDLRTMPRYVQEQAFVAGLIPFIPADRKA